VVGDREGDIEVARTFPVTPHGHRHRRCVGAARAREAVEPAGGERPVSLPQGQETVLGNLDARPGGEVVEDELTGANVVAIHPRRELGDPERTVLADEGRLRACTAERAARGQEERQSLSLAGAVAA
jgi:hypothetical protein